ncbi:sigma-70 family RNA polymerase sigma factor [Kitasatospora kazusensis]|uniref:Sigma-70 family RNA polymerase sigma factor n=1 Tax=Kitasatospora kazusensis TaxID=407974 RepID=A0ABN1ZLS1_9ACTN
MSESGPVEGDPGFSASLGQYAPLPAPDIGAASRDGDFSLFYRAFALRLTRFLMWQGASAALAADLTQDTMIKAYQGWSRIEAPEAWSRRVSSRALVRHLSRVEEDPVDLVPEPTSLLPRPGEAAEWEQQQEILHVLRGLPPRQRQVLAWTLDGFTPAEIADELGLEPGSVRANLLKARRAVAGRMTTREEE